MSHRLPVSRSFQVDILPHCLHRPCTSLPPSQSLFTKRLTIENTLSSSLLRSKLNPCFWIRSDLYVALGNMSQECQDLNLNFPCWSHQSYSVELNMSLLLVVLGKLVLTNKICHPYLILSNTGVKLPCGLNWLKLDKKNDFFYFFFFYRTFLFH